MDATKAMFRRNRRRALVGCVLTGALLGCYRAGPPEVIEFRPPPKVVAKASAVPEAAEEVVAERTVVEAPPPPSKRDPTPVVAPTVAPREPEPDPEPVVEKGSGPSILGTWRVVAMGSTGNTQPLPEGTSMTLTVAPGGTVTMTVSNPQMPEDQIMEGTYELDGDRITVTIQGETRSGTYTFDGNNRVTLDMGGMGLILERS